MKKKRVWEFRHVRTMATGLFFLVTVIFVLTHILAHRYPWLRVVEAFSEAAMVGSIADWFAVTALFRRPLGIPWHTEIIPRKKDAIGRNLGIFIEENFLSRKVIYRRLRDADLSKRIALWFEKPGNVELVAGEFSHFMAGFVEFVSDDDVRRFAGMSFMSQERISKLNPSKWFGEILDLLMLEGRHHRLFDEALEYMRHAFQENKDMILDRINQRSYWFIPSFVDNKVFNDFITMVDEFFNEVEDDPEHEVRLRFDMSMKAFVERLRNSEEYRQRVESIIYNLMENPATREFVDGIWADIKVRVISSLSDPYSTLRSDIEKFILHSAGRLRQDKAMRVVLNRMLMSLILYMVSQYRQSVSAFVAAQMNSWGSNELTSKLEFHVGADLQFIRINGTIIGGLAGVLIYLVAQLF